jgi:predicted dienelactone hydrolase
MLKRFFKYTFLTLAVLLSAVAILFFVTSKKTPVDTLSPVGFLETSYNDESRSRQLDLYVWYPTNETETVELIGENAVFRGFSAIQNAAIAEGTHPLIVLSHGSGGNRTNQAWLAVELARQGAIVVAGNHPGSTSRDSAPATNILTWNRPADISFMIDSVLADAQFAASIDAKRIAVVGHSLGGYTALAIGGATLSLEKFIDYCNTFSKNPDCVFYREGGVDLSQVDLSKFEQSNRDERVSAIVVIDPAYASSFQAESLATLTDTLFIAPVVEKDSVEDTQVSYLAEQLAPDQDFIKLAGSQHFTFLAECKPLGYYMLMVVEKGAEALCKRESVSTRSEFHDLAASAIIKFLEAKAILGAPLAQWNIDQ